MNITRYAFSRMDFGMKNVQYMLVGAMINSSKKY